MILRQLCKYAAQEIYAELSKLKGGYVCLCFLTYPPSVIRAFGLLHIFYFEFDAAVHRLAVLGLVIGDWSSITITL